MHQTSPGPAAAAARTDRCHRVGRERRDRAAAGTIYACLGVVAGSWSARIPAVQRQSGLSPEELGIALFGSGLGILVGLGLAAPLSWRIAGRRWAAAAGIGYGALLTLAGLARSFGVLFGALFAVGLIGGVLTAQQNLVAVGIERAHGRPVMSFLFGMQGLGVLVGGGAGALAAAGGLSPAAHFALVAVVVAVVVVAGCPWLVEPYATEPKAVRGHVVPTARTGLLAGMAFAAVLTFGTTMDWSAVYLSGDLGAPQGLAAVAPTAFVGLVSLARLAGDPVSVRYGTVATLRVGLGVASVGLVLVAAASGPPMALAGFALAGIGLSCMLPLVIAVAARILPSRAAAVLALVTFVANGAYLVGPPLAGLVAAQLGLSTVFVGLALLLSLAGVLAGWAFEGRRPPEPRPARSGDGTCSHRPEWR